MYEFKLPDLGEGIHEGEILKWHVQPGSAIQENAPLVDVETDKAAVTLPSPRGGTIVSTAGAIGERVQVGKILAVIEELAGAAKAPASALVLQTAKARADSPQPTTALSSAGKGSPTPAAPATRRLARVLGIDIALVPATGPGGRVTSEDVKRFAAGRSAVAITPSAVTSVVSPAAKPTMTKTSAVATTPSAVTSVVSPAAAKPELAETSAAELCDVPLPDAKAASAIPFLALEPLPNFEQWGPVEKESLRSIRRKVARKMVTSMILAPHVALMDEIDITALEALRQRENQRRVGEPELTLLSFVVKALTTGLKNFAMFNASIDPFREEIIYKKYYHIGIAVDTGKGLIVPVIKSAEHKSILQIAIAIRELARSAREGTIEVANLQGGTFTITNVGPLGGTHLIPIINYPEVAILGMGRVQEKPVVREGQIVIRQMLPLTLAFDHRIADGADAARFLSKIVQMLADPEQFLLQIT